MTVRAAHPQSLSSAAPSAIGETSVADATVWWAVAVIVVAIVAAYLNSFPGAFFFDDDDAIVLNASIRSLHDLRQVLWPPVQAGIGGRPFGNLTFALNYAFGGYNPAGYHAVNLVIHVAGALLLFAVVRRTLRMPALIARFGESATYLAAIISLLWALHPVQTNIVDYMSQRTEGLMSALYLLTLYAFIRSVEESSRGWLWIAFVACVLGVATKEGMVTVPAIALLYDRTFLSGSFADALRRNWRKYLALASTWVLLAGLLYFSKPGERGVGFGLGHGALDYALTECRAVVRYLQLSVWPHTLVFDYGTQFYVHGIQALPSVIILALALLGTGLALWRAPMIGFLAAWFFVLLSPSSSVIPVAQQPCGENRMYLPLAGIAALIGVVGYRAAGRRALTLFVVAIVALGAATWLRNPVFASEEAVWRDTVTKNPTNARAANNLGNALLKAGRNDEAMPYFETAIRLSPTYADAHNNRGVTLLRQGNPQEAVKEFELAKSEKDNYADAFYNLGEAYLQLNRPTDAIPPLETAIRLQPGNSKAHNNIGIAFLDTGRVQESINEERLALALNPNMPEAHYNLGNSLARAGRNDEALDEYAATVQLDPKFAKAYNNGGVILLQRGQDAAAAERFEAALRIWPTYPEAKRNLELVRQRRKS